MIKSTTHARCYADSKFKSSTKIFTSSQVASSNSGESARLYLNMLIIIHQIISKNLLSTKNELFYKDKGILTEGAIY